MEGRMLTVWATVLGLEVGPESDFFLELGGNSLQAMQLVDAVATEFDADVTVRMLFDNPTPASLLGALLPAVAG